jgi:sirohydrochlorin ferrochelatase
VESLGIVIIGHGSRVPESRGIYEEIAKKTQEKAGVRVKVGL